MLISSFILTQKMYHVELIFFYYQFFLLENISKVALKHQFSYFVLFNKVFTLNLVLNLNKTQKCRKNVKYLEKNFPKTFKNP